MKTFEHAKEELYLCPNYNKCDGFMSGHRPCGHNFPHKKNGVCHCPSCGERIDIGECKLVEGTV